jgi:hypothetical protein
MSLAGYPIKFKDPCCGHACKGSIKGKGGRRMKILGGTKIVLSFFPVVVFVFTSNAEQALKW